MTTALALPTDNLLRTAGSFELRSEGDGRTLVGHPIVFNVATEIDSWEGHFIERIARGSTTKTIAERGAQIQVLFNHGLDPQIGKKPLGVPSVMKEDRTGLYTEVPLADTSYNKDLLALLTPNAHGRSALSGMSFQFRVIKQELNEHPRASADNPNRLPERTVTELQLFEFGPVTFPQYHDADAALRASLGLTAQPVVVEGIVPATEEDVEALAEARSLNVQDWWKREAEARFNKLSGS